MDEKKQLILSVAIQLFSEKGFDATSVEEITKKCGIAKGSFYNIFGSKEELLLEIFIMIPKNIKTGLTKIYNKQYVTSEDKLTDFISLCFDNLLAHPTQLLMDTMMANSIVKNQDVAMRAEEIMLTFHSWIRELLLDLYGEKVEKYMGDLITLLSGVIFHYIHLFNCQRYQIQSDKIAGFIATLFEIIINGFFEKETIPLMKNAGLFLTNASSPASDAQIVRELFKLIETKLSSGIVSEASDYLRTLAILEEEYVKKKPEKVLIKALLHYLEAVPIIQLECEQLKKLLLMTECSLEEK